MLSRYVCLAKVFRAESARTMGNTNTTHTMARLGKLGSAMKEVRIQKAAGEALGLNMKSLVVASVDDPSPAQRHGCGVVLGLRLASVNGTFVQSAAEVREMVAGLTELVLCFIPKELPLAMERHQEDGALGLCLTNDAVLTDVTPGTVAARCRAEQYIGLRIVSVGGTPLMDVTDVEEKTRGERTVTFGFAIPFPDNTPEAQAATLRRRASRQGSLHGMMAADERRHSRSSPKGLAGDAPSGDGSPASSSSPVGAVGWHGSFSTRRRSSLTPLLQPLPKLAVASPNRWQHCSGVYSTKHQPLVNGCRLWKRDADAGAASAGDRWLYSTPNGFWRITDSEGDFTKGAGYIISREKHGGRMPQEMPMWQTKGYTDDGDIKVTPEYAPEDIYEYTPPALQVAVGMQVRVVSGRNIGMGGVVAEVREGGVAVLDTGREVEAARLYQELDNEVALVRPAAGSEAALCPIGMTFRPSGDLYLKGVVPHSPAELFGLSQFASRRLIRVNGVSVHTPRDLAAAVADTTDAGLLVLAFAPSETVSACRHLDLLLAAEDLERRAKDHRRELEMLSMAQEGFAQAFVHAERWYRSWSDAKLRIQTVIRRCVIEGAGEAGCQEALAKFEPEQTRLVENITHAVAAAQGCLESGALLLSPAKETFLEVTESMAGYNKSVAVAAPLVASVKIQQARVDELDELAYKQRRSLVRNPKDEALALALQATEGDLTQCESAVATLVQRMDDMVDVLPQLYAYILPHNQMIKSKPAGTS